MTSNHSVALAFEDGITRFIDCAEDQTVADAAYQAKINIPFDCRDGACGTCKAFCESGDFDEGSFVDEALTPEEFDEGYCLPCQMKPLSDIVLQVATTSAAAKTGASTFEGTVTDVRPLSDSTFHLEVELDTPTELNFLPGQYINITVPGSDQTRSYSFSSGPKEGKQSFLIKNTPGGLMTNWLADTAKVGDRLTMTGPFGSFFLREPVNPILLLAGGTGLAPILSILEQLANDELLDVPVRLIYGATFDHDVVQLERIESYKESLPDFDYSVVVADKESTAELKGYVTDHCDADEHLHNGEADIYLCGPPPMVEAVRTFLNNQDNPPENFFFEKFNPSSQVAEDADKPTATPVDEGAESLVGASR
ncbi:benzoate 1,2-dioxygenase electron transfer component BenC [Corynebacterium sp. H113]|uniref:benzoate 1,2-dioxygenase electron transfer component BenC n=1 Tax=Corynebacterium sp. H113 TaxID=3133419 RepID=UPI0040400C4B